VTLAGFFGNLDFSLGSFIYFFFPDQKFSRMGGIFFYADGNVSFEDEGNTFPFLSRDIGLPVF